MSTQAERERARAYYLARREEICSRVGTYAKANKAKVAKRKQNYYIQHRDNPHYREVAQRGSQAYIERHGYRSNAMNARKSEHHKHRVYHQNLLWRWAKGRQRNWRKNDDIGCTSVEFQAHIERQFTPEMNWDNYGSYWSFDHIKSKSQFDLSKAEDRKACFHFTNIRPLQCSKNKVQRTLTLKTKE